MQETRAQSGPQADAQAPPTHSESAFQQDGQVVRQPAAVYKALLYTPPGTRTLPSWSRSTSGRETETNKYNETISDSKALFEGNKTGE